MKDLNKPSKHNWQIFLVNFVCAIAIAIIVDLIKGR